MLREARRRKQQVAGKIGHEEYIYRLSGDPFSHQEEIHRRPQGNLDPRRVQAAGGGVGVAGARGVAGSSQPPFAVDDDANYGGGGRGGRGARLNPISGVPDAGPSNEAPALYGAPGGYIDGTPPAKKYAAANYASPYSGGGAGGYPYPFMPQVQPIVSAFAPVIPAIAPVRDLPAPLPAVYRPKPPLTFHSGPTSSAEVPPLSFSPLPQHPVPPQMGDLSHDAGTPRAAAAPMYLSPGDNGAGRPKTSPTVLPPLNPDAASNGGGNLFPTRSPRPSTSRATLGGGGVGGGFIIGNDGLSDVEQRQREKRAARMRAIELQQENARQMLEQQQRKQAEREREIQEDRLTEQRLQREREEVARREQAELDREKREKELKMMGPRAAQAMLEQQQRETQQRREEEAAARRNRGRAQADVAAPGTGKGTPKPTISPPPTSASAAPTILPSLPPANHMMPLSAPSVLSPPVSASTLPYLVNFNLGGGLRPLPQPSPALYNYPLANACPQAAPLPNGETQAIRSELRRITNLLEQQQQQQQRRAMDSTSFGAKVAPQPWHSGVPQPSTAAGAGTYLTTGQPSPSLDAGGDAPVTSAQRNSAAPYRPFLTGGTLPPPPLTTAAPPAPSSSDAGAPPVSIGPWQGLFSSCASTSATGAGGSLLNPSCGSARQLASSITDNDPELSTEPSRFIGPFRAPMAALPSPPVTPEPEVTVVVVESTTRKPLPASVFCAAVAETVSAHSMVTTPLASEAASFRLSTAASVSASALEAFSEPEACSPARSVEVESLCSVHHISSSTAKRLRINTNEDKSERQGSASPLPKVVVAYTSSVQSLTSSQAELPRE
ncbi:hypothetical protein LPMP_211230 [Leishmania panamensis]|uniref:Uncharacterized protein n=1 Tax=Leishmania panamensis TaxID=5679 RepID=A0A088RQ58_LEIPA|nr:hypothetical protein LPMP_211230 [Leishmania panamensis]AIN98202.1 hypothetical protein LPMP_211230 [Leishmania panamensis]